MVFEEKYRLHEVEDRALWKQGENPLRRSLIKKKMVNLN